MKIYIEKKVLVGFIIALAIISWLGVHAYHNKKNFARMSDQVSHTNRVLFHSQELLASLMKLETSQRGYALTGKQEFLHAAVDGMRDVQTPVKTLLDLTVDNSSQQKRLKEMHTLIEKKIKFTEDIIEARKISFEQSQLMIASMEGEVLTDKIRTLTRSFQQEENQLLLDRIHARDEKTEDFNIAFLALMVNTIVILIFLFAAINSNFRARTRAEYSLVRASTEIKDLYDRAPCGYCSWNSEGIVTDVNNTLLEWLQYDRDEVVQRPIAPLCAGDNISSFETEMLGLLKQNKEVQSYECTLLRKDETTFPVIMNATAIVDANGRFVKSRSTIFDISDRKKIEEKVVQLNKELEAFTYSVSHDLRAPLRSINGYTKIMQEDYADKLDDEGRRIMGIIIKSAERMGKLIDDLLDFSRVGRKEMVKARYRMENLVSSVVLELTERAEHLREFIKIQSLVPSEVDADLMRQVWINLVSNAIKYSKKSNPPQIEIGSYENATGVTYFVKDNGVGFDMNYSHKLFQVFQRLHRQEEFEGTGVGLAIVHRIVDRHGGKVWAESEVNTGATFYFTIPK